MRKTTLIMTAVAAAGLGILMANTASAQTNPATLQWSGDVGGECLFSAPVPGTLDVTGITIKTLTNATVSVTNNDADFYKVTAGTIQLGTKPAGMSLAAAPTGSDLMATWTGPNATNASGLSLLRMTAVGTDNLTVGFKNAQLNQGALAGTYGMSVVLTCGPR